jgi:hypothetical protein
VGNQSDASAMVASRVRRHPPGWAPSFGLRDLQTCGMTPGDRLYNRKLEGLCGKIFQNHFRGKPLSLRLAGYSVFVGGGVGEGGPLETE